MHVLTFGIRRTLRKLYFRPKCFFIMAYTVLIRDKILNKKQYPKAKSESTKRQRV